MAKIIEVFTCEGCQGEEGPVQFACKDCGEKYCESCANVHDRVCPVCIQENIKRFPG
jgi:hypothetical protein